MKDIAIIGISCRMPEANNVEAFLKNLKAGKDSVRPLTRDKKIYNCLNLSKEFKESAYLDRVDFFDYSFFNIPLEDAKLIDPQQRMLLELTCTAIEDAGYSLSDYKGSNTGVFVATSLTEYYYKLPGDSASAITGNLKASAAGRISYLLNLHGQSITVDTACSSSMVALIQACNALEIGSIDHAIVGGASINLTFPEVSKKSNQMGLGSSSNRCKTFSEDADGIGMGEGGGVFLLKKLENAQADQDHIYAVIKGSAINHDGNRKVGFGAPSPEAQKDLLLSAWRNAEIDPHSISYIEAHGTGTKLGDPIEFKAVNDAFQEYDYKGKCKIGSVKTNIAHLDAVAGVAGVLKVILSLKEKLLFPSLHMNKPNPLIGYENSLLEVNKELASWTHKEGKLCAGISSFGFTGTNAHVVLEEYKSNKEIAVSEDKETLITVSAMDNDVLLEYLKNLKDSIDQTDGSIEEMAYTLNNGRDDYHCRIAFIVKNKKDFKDKLKNAIFLEKEAGCKSSRATILLGANCTLNNKIKKWIGSDSDWNHIDKLSKSKSEIEVIKNHLTILAFLEKNGISNKSIVACDIGQLSLDIFRNELIIKEDGTLNTSLEISTFDNIQFDTSCTFLTIGQEIKKDPKSIDLIDLLNDNRSINEIVGQLYQLGIDINWKQYYRNQKYRRIMLPTYPFKKTRAWYEDPLDSGDWVYELNWVERNKAINRLDYHADVYIIFMDAGEVGDVIIKKLNDQNKKAIKVYQGEEFKKIDADSYLISTLEENHYQQIVSDINEQNICILHFSNLEYEQTLNKEIGKSSQMLFVMAKAFSDLFENRNCRFLHFSVNAYKINDHDQLPNPDKAACNGFCRGMYAEYPRVIGESIDFSSNDNKWDQIDYIERKITNHDHDYKVKCLRRKVEFIPLVKQVNIDRISVEKQIKPKGVYVLTGGLSGIGFEICKWFLTKDSTIQLVILGRTDLQSSASDDLMKDKKQNLNFLRHINKDTVYFSVDISDDQLMARTIDTIKVKYSAINGVIHSAASPGKKWIKRNSLKEFEKIYNSRSKGFVNLVDNISPEGLDFFVLFSSLSSLLPGIPRKADYAASCVFSETLAVRLNCQAKNKIKVISWCDWQETGMSSRVKGAKSEAAFLHLTNQEGLSVFEQILNTDVQHSYILAKPDLANTEDKRQNGYFDWEVSCNENSLQESKEGNILNTSLDFNIRAKTIEEEITESWEKVLGVENLTTNSNFFDLGGDSINGMRVISDLEEKLDMRLDFDDIYKFPTIKSLAIYLKQQARPDEDELDTLLNQLEKGEITPEQAKGKI